MKKPPNPKLLASLAAILTKYDPDELHDAIELIFDPKRQDLLREFHNRANKFRPNNKTEIPNEPIDRERISSIKKARPTDADVIDKAISALGNTPWTKANPIMRRLAHRHNLRPINGKTSKQRQDQFLSLVENASPTLLNEIISDLQLTHQEGSTLEQWSEIILRDRKS